MLGILQGIALDDAGNLYIADAGPRQAFDDHRIRKVAALTGNISTVAGRGSGDGGQAMSAMLNGPSGVALDDAGNIYIVEEDRNRVRKIDASTGHISTVAGTGKEGFGGDGGPATAAMLNQPQGIALDGAGNLYIADWGNCRIRRVRPVERKARSTRARFL